MAESIRFDLGPSIGGGGALGNLREIKISRESTGYREIALGIRRPVGMSETEQADRISAPKMHVAQFCRNKMIAPWRKTLQASVKAANEAEH